MAKHDRITIHVKDAPPVVLVARGAGASVDFDRGREWTTAAEYNNGRPPAMIREATVRTDSVISIVRDRVTDDPKPEAPKRPRRREEPDPPQATASLLDG